MIRTSAICAARNSRIALSLTAALIVGSASAQTVGEQKVALTQLLPPAATKSALEVGSTSSSKVIHLAIAMPSSDARAFQIAANMVSDPTSPSYRHYLTPAQIGAQFGQPQSVVQNVVNYLKASGFKITLISPNNMAILADATVGQAEAAFSTSISNFHLLTASEEGNTDFYSFTKPIQVPRSMASKIQAISGLENFEKPHALHKLAKQATSPITVNQTRVLYNTAPLYNSGFQGTGRTVAISNWDGYRLSNLSLLYSTYGLPTPAGGVGSNVTINSIDGGAGSGAPGGEGDLDIQMELGAAPLAHLIIYDGGGDLLDVLTTEASDNKADIISESWEWGLDDPTMAACHSQHLAMTLQGITYMSAAGDTGTTYRFIYPHIDPEVMSIGGTVATITSTGARVSETAWNGGGGGWNTIVEPFNVLPSWQKGTTVPTNIPFRMIPDIAFNAAGPNGAFYFVLNGALQGGYDETSFASPVCAGCLAVTEQKLVSLGSLPTFGSFHRLGRLQDLIYQQNGRPDVYFDITSGSNGQLPDGSTSNGKPGWDFTSGWGAIDFNAFVKTFKVVSGSTVNPTAVAVFAPQGQGGVGTIASLTTVDSNYYSLQSVLMPTIGQVAAVKITFTVGDTSKVNTMSVKIVGRSSANTTNFVYLYNPSTGQYDLVSTTPYSFSASTLTISVPNIQKYTSNGSLIVVDRAISPLRQGTGGFGLSFDQCVINETS